MSLSSPAPAEWDLPDSAACSLRGLFGGVERLAEFLFPVGFGGGVFPADAALGGVLGDDDRAFGAHEDFLVPAVTGGRVQVVVPANGVLDAVGLFRPFVDGDHVVVPFHLRVVVGAAGRHDAERRVADDPVEDVDLVAAEVGDRSAGELLVPPPVPQVLHRVVAVLLQRRRGQRGVLGPGRRAAAWRGSSSPRRWSAGRTPSCSRRSRSMVW